MDQEEKPITATGRQWRALCSTCNWRGPTENYESVANTDAEIHKSEAGKSAHRTSVVEV